MVIWEDFYKHKGTSFRILIISLINLKLAGSIQSADSWQGKECHMQDKALFDCHKNRNELKTNSFQRKKYRLNKSIYSPESVNEEWQVNVWISLISKNCSILWVRFMDLIELNSSFWLNCAGRIAFIQLWYAFAVCRRIEVLFVYRNEKPIFYAD